MARTHVTRPAAHATAWEPVVFDRLDAHDTSLDADEATIDSHTTKLATIATGATANSTDATLLSRANHTGTQSADTITDGTTNKAYTATEKTKLAGVATGATANSSDATLLNRTNHTGTQAISTVTGLQAAIDNVVYKMDPATYTDADLTGALTAATTLAPNAKFVAVKVAGS